VHTISSTTGIPDQNPLGILPIPWKNDRLIVKKAVAGFCPTSERERQSPKAGQKRLPGLGDKGDLDCEKPLQPPATQDESRWIGIKKIRESGHKDFPIENRTRGKKGKHNNDSPNQLIRNFN
jgi:hypothetical protein